MASREEIDNEYAMDNRPVEPYVSNEDPEMWREIAEWEAERADTYRDALTAAENERDEMKTSREGWAARSKEDFDRLGRALENVRRKRSTGEPACSDGEAVEELVAERDRLRDALQEIAKRMDGAGWLARKTLQEAEDE